MQIQLENTGALERRMTVRLPTDQLESRVRARMQELSRTVRLKGFRPGKVPPKVLEQRFGGEVRREALTDVIGSSFREAVRQQNLRPAMPPSIELPSDGGPELEYTATFEVMPEIGSIDVANLEVVRVEAEVTEADIDRMIETLREQRRQWNKVDRGAEPGDMVLFEFVAEADGFRWPEAGMERAGTILGTGALFPEFEAMLAGAQAGDERSGELVFPDGFREASLAGRTAKVTIRVMRVQTSALPALDDAFFASFGVREGGLERFRAEVRANLERELGIALRARRKASVIEKLLATYTDFELPKGMVAAEQQALEAQARQRAEQAGQPAPTAPELFAREAETRVRAFLLIDEIARQQGIAPDADRVRQELLSIASTYEEPEKVIELYARDQQLMSNLRNRVLEDQIVDWVFAHARVVSQPATFAEVMRPGA
jgi:trigger factor